jgi:hypothetical protein
MQRAANSSPGRLMTMMSGTPASAYFRRCAVAPIEIERWDDVLASEEMAPQGEVADRELARSSSGRKYPLKRSVHVVAHDWGGTSAYGATSPLASRRRKTGIHPLEPVPARGSNVGFVIENPELPRAMRAT